MTLTPSKLTVLRLLAAPVWTATLPLNVVHVASADAPAASVTVVVAETLQAAVQKLIRGLHGSMIYEAIEG